MIAGVFEIPGYVEAVLKERQIRDAAFLPVNENIDGFEVVPMTLQQYDILRFTGNPILQKEGIPSPRQLVNFLWLLNPAYRAGISAPPWFLKKCRAFIMPTPPILKTETAMLIYGRKVESAMQGAVEIIALCRQFVEEATMDFPSSGSKSTKSYYSDIAGLCHIFAIKYGWDDEKTLRTPLKRLLQYSNAMKEASDKTAVSNPSDRVLGAWISETNRRRN